MSECFFSGPQGIMLCPSLGSFASNSVLQLLNPSFMVILHILNIHYFSIDNNIC